MNLFQMMFEDDPPAVDTEADSPPPAEDNTPPPVDDPPEPADSPPADDTGGDAGGPPPIDDTTDDGGYDDTGEGEQPEQQDDDLALDEKGEIFAKLKIIKEFRHLYDKINDTIETIDKIDFVQIGNNISSTSIGDVKDELSQLMNDVYTTIVYEFQQQYANLKVKMVEYSSRYVLIVKKLTTLIKKDQKTPSEE